MPSLQCFTRDLWGKSGHLGLRGKAASVDTAQLCPCQADILVSKQATDQEQGGINKRKMLALSALSGPRQPRLPWRRTYLQPKG